MTDSPPAICLVEKSTSPMDAETLASAPLRHIIDHPKDAVLTWAHANYQLWVKQHALAPILTEERGIANVNLAYWAQCIKLIERA